MSHDNPYNWLNASHCVNRSSFLWYIVAHKMSVSLLNSSFLQCNWLRLHLMMWNIVITQVCMCAYTYTQNKIYHVPDHETILARLIHLVINLFYVHTYGYCMDIQSAWGVILLILYTHVSYSCTHIYIYKLYMYMLMYVWKWHMQLVLQKPSITNSL